MTKDPGQTAYEARFSKEDREKRWFKEWDKLLAEDREIWARVEDAVRASPPRPAATDAPERHQGGKLSANDEKRDPQ